LRLHAALLALLLCGGQSLAAETSLDCHPTAQILCSADGTCSESATEPLEVRFWPERTPVEACRAAHCPDLGPSIFLCGPDSCGGGAVAYAHEWRPGQHGLKGMAYVAPDPGPRLYTARFYALAFEPESGTLALSRFDSEGLETTWLACVPAAKMEN
jgi:hypothetical protein